MMLAGISGFVAVIGLVVLVTGISLLHHVSDIPKSGGTKEQQRAKRTRGWICVVVGIAVFIIGCTAFGV